MKPPLVSVIAACYNQSRFVVECLESIRHQSYKNLQLIITDDCSQDDSVLVIRNWLKSTSTEAIFLAQDKNIGFCRTLNNALSHATGKYISIIAADDVFMPDKFENQVAILERAPAHVGVVYSDSWQMDEQGNLLPLMFIEAHRKLSTPPSGNLFPVLLEKNFIPAMTVLIRRECFDKVGLYDEKLCYEDFDMWLRIAQHYKFIYSPEISAKYRIVSNSMSRCVLHVDGLESLSSNFQIYEKCLTSENTNQAQRTVILDQLETIAERMYNVDCKGQSRYLLRLCRYRARPYILGMFVFSVLGIAYEHFVKTFDWVGLIKRRFRAFAFK